MNRVERTVARLVRAFGMGVSTSGARSTRPDPVVAGQGALFFATDNGITYRSNGSAWTAIAWMPIRVTTLPLGPEDKQRIEYSPATGVVWTFAYNAGSGSSLKWEYVGGADRYIEGVSGTTTNTPGYNATITGGTTPSFTAPFAGDYVYEYGANLSQNGALTVLGAPEGGDITAADADAIRTSATALTTASRKKLVTNVAAAGLIRMLWRVSGAVTGSINSPWISVRPVKIG